MVYAEIVVRLVLKPNEAEWTLGKLASLLLETSKLEASDEKIFATHCLSGIFILEFHLQDHGQEESKRSRSLWSTDARPLEQFIVLTEQSYRMTSRRCSTRVYETVHGLSRARESAWIAES